MEMPEVAERRAPQQGGRVPILRGETMSLSERNFMAQVIDLAHYCGWRVAHFRPARMAHGWRTPVGADGAGFPDLLMVREGVQIVAELKTEDGRLSEEQGRWLDTFETVCRCYSWRPSQWQEIEEALR
jgi:hypothetical protein